MHWTEDGRIQVTRNFAIGAAAVIVGLALVMMFFAGTLISRDGDSVPRLQPDLTSNEQDENEDRDISTGTASKSRYSTCLARTWRAISLDTSDVEFKPWAERTTKRKTHGIIELRHVDYISNHCSDLAPEPRGPYQATCIPKELQAFYRRHVPEGKDSSSHMAIAAEYALTVCQPSVEG